MTFFYPFVNFLQPGILWPALADLRPMIVISLLALGVGMFRTPDFPRGMMFGHAAFKWLCVFILVQVLSVHYGGLFAMVEGFSFWGMYLLFVITSFTLISGAAALRSYVWGMLAGSMFVIGYGIYGLFAWGGYIYEWSGVASGRAGAYGMYLNHNDYSFIIIQIVPFLYMYWREERGFIRRLLLSLSLLTSVAGIFMSLSRGGVLALLLEFLLIVLMGMQGKRRFLLLPVLVMVGGAAIIYQWEKREENQGPGGYTTEAAESTRYELWRAARKIFEDKPLLGVGSLRFGEYAKQYAELSHDNLGKNAHNTYLDILAGTGLFGLGSFLLMLYYLRRDLAIAPKETGPPFVEATRIAALIALYAIAFRAVLDAKSIDWSFYVLCVVGVACRSIQRHAESRLGGESAPRSPQILAPGNSHRLA